MKSQQQTWYRAGGDIVARAGFSLAMCGGLAAVVYLTGHNGSQEVSVASAGGVARTATVVASVDSQALYKSQAAVDASPGALPVPAKIPVPLERVAEASPTPARRPAVPLKRPGAQQVAVASNVLRFESCLPGCDTRDPLIVGHAEKTPDPGVSPSPTDELVEQVSFTQRTPSILGRAMDAPGAVYRTGRNALTSLVRAAL